MEDRNKVNNGQQGGRTVNRTGTSRFSPQDRLVAGMLKKYKVKTLEKLRMIGGTVRVYWGTEQERGAVPPGLFDGLEIGESMTPDQIIMEGDEEA